MSTEQHAPQGITKEQLDDLRRSVSATAQEVAQKAIEGLSTDIKDKTKTAVIEGLRDQKLGVEVQTGKTDSRRLKILLAIIPAIATMLAVMLAVILGFFIWVKQKDIETTIGQQDRNLTTQLALTQEFYKRKFDIYEKAHQQMTALLGALQVSRLDPAAQTQAFDRLSDLDTASKTNQLYMTDDVAKGLSEVWLTATEWLSNHGKIENVAQKNNSYRKDDERRTNSSQYR